MQYSVIIIAFAAAAVSAMPKGLMAGSQGSCNVNSVVSCCDTTQAITGSTILGGSCAVNVPALGNNCETGSAYCCEATQVGLLNVNAGCTPIDVL
ncbi:uncharacterized protein MYCFIDRAFT_185327 [Pseudocercospora fijiensis CIRAD86]|uniref:Hydrophobin n=1 Tax=Pseudocercospora fijiensis (strain CIRAD86) TaxID=383855 RepID=N1Q7R9_PSEFD|nr:uncharacterized protein MYCFIDRAFT_185327 [Pseudocercospora fijiensis CIRAD86]EME88790.1 hypothetical protein MYCFIDRAFT_185327 [Pseudocercospora fijiensis CIRAD86]